MTALWSATIASHVLLLSLLAYRRKLLACPAFTAMIALGLLASIPLFQPHDWKMYVFFEVATLIAEILVVIHAKEPAIWMPVLICSIAKTVLLGMYLSHIMGLFATKDVAYIGQHGLHNLRFVSLFLILYWSVHLERSRKGTARTSEA